MAAAVALLLAPGASAHDQDAAPTLRDDVERVWHEPDGMHAGEQFRGFIRFTEDTTVQGVGYQVCIIQQIVCIISPRPAALLEDGRTWAFDTADFVNPQTGRSHPWPEGRIGVQYFLSDSPFAANRTDEDMETLTRFPDGPPLDSDECSGGLHRMVACYEDHYFAFDVAPDPTVSAPGPGALLAAAAIAAAAIASARAPRRRP